MRISDWSSDVCSSDLRDRDDSVADDQADGRLDPDQRGDGGRADDAAVGFGADAHHGKVGGDRAAGAGTRAAGAAVERVRIARLAAGRPPRRGPIGSAPWREGVGPYGSDSVVPGSL